MKGAIRLYDTSNAFIRNEEAAIAVREGYEFLVIIVESS